MVKLLVYSREVYIHRMLNLFMRMVYAKLTSSSGLARLETKMWSVYGMATGVDGSTQIRLVLYLAITYAWPPQYSCG